ncbi:hypothetical protein ONE63_005246 [Megalurothrips usitatus]|uniref:CD80-like immunoglobulin C2-set domain-containing protein n=1 Tax=Megalurothrips usitatus TaxID=439358 RepID=A0AAV7Y1N4_9NEOP|nr:hypothetical protein ONE63_005246 [Megalurothrips usitatus]
MFSPLSAAAPPRDFLASGRPDSKAPVLVVLQLAQSDASSVTLLNVTRALVGFYKCEVSGDQPLFHTDIKLEYLNVYEPPSRKPELTVEKLPSGALRANCSTAPSFPGANITWYVDNNKHGPPAPAVHFHAREQDEWSSSELRLDAASRPRALRCEASLYTWKQSSDEVPLRGPGDHPQLAPVRGAASRASACGESCVQPDSCLRLSHN